MIGRRTLLLLNLTAVLAATGATPAVTADRTTAGFVASTGAPCSSQPHLHYAGIETTTSSQIVSTGGCLPGTANNTWLGIDGQIVTPGVISLLNHPKDHDSGYLDASFGPNQWFQIGFTSGYSGTLEANCEALHHCINIATNTWHMYVEVQGVSSYYIADLGALSLGQAVTYRILYNTNTGCWESFYNYSTPAKTYCGFASSGQMMVMRELFDGNNSHEAWVVASFGNSVPATNATLRLFRGHAWEDWDTSLSSGGTDVYYDTGNAAGKNFVFSSTHSWYNFETYSN